MESATPISASRISEAYARVERLIAADEPVILDGGIATELASGLRHLVLHVDVSRRGLGAWLRP